MVIKKVRKKLVKWLTGIDNRNMWVKALWGKKRINFYGQGEKNETVSRGVMIEPTSASRTLYSHCVRSSDRKCGQPATARLKERAWFAVKEAKEGIGLTWHCGQVRSAGVSKCGIWNLPRIPALDFDTWKSEANSVCTMKCQKLFTIANGWLLLEEIWLSIFREWAHTHPFRGNTKWKVYRFFNKRKIEIERCGELKGDRWSGCNHTSFYISLCKHEIIKNKI